MANHKDDDATSYFCYDEVSKFKHIVFTSKNIISSLKRDNSKLLEETDNIKEKQYILINYSSSLDDPVEPTTREQCTVLKNKFMIA